MYGQNKPEISEELKAQLEKMDYEMLLNINEKMVVENDYYLRKRIDEDMVKNGRGHGFYNPYEAEKELHRRLLALDQKGFQMSLAKEEVLYQNGIKRLDPIENWACNYLYHYGLSYPISWRTIGQDRDGLIFEYFRANKINADYEKFVQEKIAPLKVSEFEKQRLLGICEFYRKRRLIVTKYKNHEDIDALTAPEENTVSQGPSM